MPKLQEAVTIRARAQSAARALRDLLKEKTLPAELRKQVENLSNAMSKTWADLAADAKLDPERESRSQITQIMQMIREAANMGEYLEAMLHLRFTEMADYAFSEGRLTRDERIVISHAIGQALDAFHLAVMERAVQLYARGPWEGSDGSSMQVQASEPNATLHRCVQHVMDQGHDEQSAYAICQAAVGEGAKPPKGVSLEVFEQARKIMQEGRGVCESDALEMEGEYIPLVEKSVRKDGTIPIKVIAPGWGTSGYYSAEMLERDGPQKLKAGTKMYWDHPTASEERERPERSLRDLAAETVTDARWDVAGPAGPGLYAEAQVFEPYQAVVDELGPHIGVSIRALGKAIIGQAEGRTGKVINEISQVSSVDFVTSPGAGGEVLQIFEAARQGQPGRDADGRAGLSYAQQGRSDAGQSIPEKEESMPVELKALQEANAALEAELEQQKAAMARLSEMLVLREAGDFARLVLAKVQLPEVTKTRLLKQLVTEAPIKDGRVDAASFATQIAEAVKVEQAYLAEAAGIGAGQISGFGDQGEWKPEDVEADLAESFRRMGLSDKVAEQAAKGRGEITRHGGNNG